MDKREDILVSVCCMAYNHHEYIRRCLDGFLMQKTNFAFEVLVHDDASTDGTDIIIKEYEERFPRIFKNVYQIENQFQKQNALINILFQNAKGKYTALCEGDDYWTDPFKLQRQVDFLERSTEYSMCFHRVMELTANHLTLSNLNQQKQECSYDIYDLATGNFIHTPSIVFKRLGKADLPSWFFDSPVGDYVLHMISAKKGKIYYMPEPMAVYRRNSGIWSSQNTIKLNLNWYKTLDYLIQEFSYDDKIVSSLERQKAQSLMRIYNAGGEDVLESGNSLVKKVLDEVTIKSANDLVKFDLKMLLFAVFKRIIYRLRNNRIAYKLVGR